MPLNVVQQAMQTQQPQSFSAWLRFSLRRNPIYAGLRFVRDRLEERRWTRATTRVGPAPHRVKVRTLLEHATQYDLHTLIETGTYYGDTIWRVRDRFTRIVSIELNATFVANARRRFRNDPHVSFVIGDSGTMLPEVLANTTERCLFWLDGHYSGEITSRADLDSPIERELMHIWRHPATDHVILIDDARDFVGRDGYPTIPELRAAVLQVRPEYSFTVENDIIRICPPRR